MEIGRASFKETLPKNVGMIGIPVMKIEDADYENNRVLHLKHSGSADRAPSRADSAEGRRPSTGPEKRSAPRAGQRLDGAVASRWRPLARSLRDRNRL